MIAITIALHNKNFLNMGKSINRPVATSAATAAANEAERRRKLQASKRRAKDRIYQQLLEIPGAPCRDQLSLIYLANNVSEGRCGGFPFSNWDDFQSWLLKHVSVREPRGRRRNSYTSVYEFLGEIPGAPDDTHGMLSYAAWNACRAPVSVFQRFENWEQFTRWWKKYYQP